MPALRQNAATARWVRRPLWRLVSRISCQLACVVESRGRRQVGDSRCPQRRARAGTSGRHGADRAGRVRGSLQLSDGVGRRRAAGPGRRTRSGREGERGAAVVPGWPAGPAPVGAAPGGGERGREKVVVIGGRTLRRSGPRSAWPSTRGSHRLGWRGPPDREAGAFSVTACFVRSTTRSMFYLALPGLTLTTGFPELRCLYRTTLALRPPSDYGSGGWGFESLAARQTRRSEAEAPCQRTQCSPPRQGQARTDVAP
jgi:hypothetical protein